MRLGWFLSSALLKVKIKIGEVAFLEWDFQIVAAVGVVAAALAAVAVAVAVAVAAAVAAVAVAAVVDITAHLGGTADRLTVNWHWRLIGLLWPRGNIRERNNWPTRDRNNWPTVGKKLFPAVAETVSKFPAVAETV